MQSFIMSDKIICKGTSLKGGSRIIGETMSDNQNGIGKDKRLVILYILEILRNSSSERHPLKRKEILAILREKYEVTCSLRSLHNYIRLLHDDGYPIITQKTGCYLQTKPQEFTDAELRMLIDGILFSRNISYKQASGMIDRLISAGSHSFQKHRKRLQFYCDNMTYSDNEETLANVSAVQKAIVQEKKIRFLYNTYDAKFSFHLKREEPYVFSPYQLIVSQGRYYVAGNMEPHENVIHCRLDRMTKVALLDEAAKPKRQMQEFKTTTLPEYVAQHFYMSTGPNAQVRIRTKEQMMDVLIDWFGKDFKILKNQGGEMEILLRCNENAIKYWALQYGDSVEILSPRNLRESVAETARGMCTMYSGEQDMKSKDKKEG